MGHWVDITFRCVPLRSMARLNPPLDAPDEVLAVFRRLRAAAEKHGFHNSYHLHDGKCVYHLTNHEQIGMLEFRFEGTVLTDADDLKTLDCDLQVDLAGEVCDWLVAAAIDWLAESVRAAVKVEFDRFIAAGDLDKTVQRLEELRIASETQGGFLGIGL
jgi:hypothetical protein